MIGEPERQVGKGLANLQLRIAEPQGGQARRIERMAPLAGMLQQQHPGATGQGRNQRAQAERQGTLAAGAGGTGHQGFRSESGRRSYRIAAALLRPSD